MARLNIDLVSNDDNTVTAVFNEIQALMKGDSDFNTITLWDYRDYKVSIESN